MALLIRNVRILGGKKEYPEPADVFVSGDRISAIGSFPDKRAEETIEGQGAYLAPGFIDLHTDSDHYLTLFDDPAQEDFLLQGVTTIIGGQCGSSLAPLLYGSLESIQKWGSANAVNVGWHSMAELLKTLEVKKLGVNFGTLVGHSTIRRAIVGEALRELTKNELGVFAATLQRALEEGGFGFSTGLAYVHARPAPYRELKTLVGEVKARGGLYAVHLRAGGEKLLSSVKETIRVAKETGVPAVVGHFLPHFGEEKEYEAALEALRDLPRGAEVFFDIYPFDESMVVLYTLLPEWAQNGGRAAMIEGIRDRWLGEKILRELPDIPGDQLTVARAPGNDFLVGKTLAELRETFGNKSNRELLLDLMRLTELNATVFYKNINEELARKALAHPRALIATNAASVRRDDFRFLNHPRATSTFTKFLGLAAKEGFIPLAEAVARITAAPARLLGLKNRGEIAEGAIADLALFRIAEGGDAAPPANVEIKAVVVGGVLAMQDGAVKGARAGKVLRRGV